MILIGRCMMYLLFTSKLNCNLKEKWGKFIHPVKLRSTQYHMMKSPAYRQLQIHLLIECLQWHMGLGSVAMNMKGLEHYHYWQVLI